MSNITFTGIQNIKISRKEYSKPANLYSAYQRKVGECTAQFREVKIAAKLTDDFSGNDFSDFQTRLPDKNLFNPSNSDDIELHMIKANIGNNSNTEETLFKLNGKPLVVYNDSFLPIFTFLARLTRESAKNPDMSQNQIKYLNLVNKSIQKTAVDYIENKTAVK